MVSVSGYEPLEVLHQSRRTVLVRARRVADGAKVVLKALRHEHASPRDVAILRNEHEVLRSLALPGVLRAWELVAEGGHVALVLEDFDAVSVRALLLAKGGLPVGPSLQIAARVAESLAEVHRRGILHGDVNPNNILTTPALDVVKLADFGSASLLARESREATSPFALRGTLAYMSPEQTGRVSRPVDERSDLYSLGCTLFEMLTGTLPFGSTDPLDVVHGHIAREAPRADAIRPEVPSIVADVVAKLLAKPAEDRYQSAAGLRADLLACAEHLERGVPLAGIRIGAHDRPPRLDAPQKLYGRERETQRIAETYERVAAGGSALVLVSGFSGIGKTALVSEIQKPLTRERGYFVAGKCDQVKRDTPYGSLVQALSSLFRQILTESEEDVVAYRRALDEAWGAGARAFVDLVPEVEKLVGPKAPLPPLGPSESQNRFDTLFDRFLQVFAERGRPLVFFLDDLQWADSGTLSLLERQMASPERKLLLVVGAYRDNEVDAGHPLSHAIANIRKAGVTVDEIRLGPLDEAALGAYVADGLRTSPEASAELARLVREKTGGNPFFAGQFLHALVDDGLLQLDASGAFAYEIEKVRAAKITDNVVELVLGKLRGLPAATQTILNLAACVGARFGLDEVATLAGMSDAAVRDALGPAVRDGFVVPVRTAGDDPALPPPALRFQHDRVQQAAYDLASPDARAATHLRLARRLLEGATPSEREARLLDVVDHLLLGASKLEDETARREAAEIALDAGRKAKASTAYGPALRYFGAGLSFLPSDARDRDYALWAGLATEHAEAEYLTNRFDAAEAAYETLIETLRTPLERAVVTLKKMVLYVTLGRNWDVLDLAKRGFALLGQELPDWRDKNAMSEAVERRFVEVEALLARHRERFEREHPGREFRLQDLLDLPLNDAPEHRALLEIMMGAIPPAYFFGEDVFKLVILEMVRLTLDGGIVDTSSFGLVLFAHVLASQRKEYRTGLEFGNLGMAVAERFHSLAYVGKTNYMMGAFVNHWGRHVRTNLPYLEKGHRLCVEAGELLWAGYSGSLGVWCLDAKGGPLDDVLAEATKHLAFARRTHHDDLAWDTLNPIRAVKALKGETDAPASFSGDGFDEARELATMEGLEKPIPLNLYLIYKSEVLFLFGRFDEALVLSRRSEGMIWAFAGMIVFAKHTFFHALILASACREDDAAAREATRKEMAPLLERFAIWSEACPENFRHQSLLLRAEDARLAGDDVTATTLFDRALDAAQEGGFVQDEAIAAELAARFHERRGRARFARAYLLDARAGYRAWGANGKVRELEARHPFLREPARAPLLVTTSLDSVSRSSGDGLGSFIDHQAVLRASQAISGEIVRPKLLSALLDVLLQTAGARRAALLHEGERGLVVEAEIDLAEGTDARLDAHPIRPGAFPESMLKYAARTGEDLVVNDSRDDRTFASDPYLASRSPRSVCCLGLKRQGREAGLLYLENELATGVFTRERHDALRILGAQAGIALDNAELYARLEAQNQILEAAVAARTRELADRNAELGDTLRKVVESQRRLASELSEAAAYVRSLLPAPLAGRVSSAWEFVPSAELGGDAFGHAWLDEHRLAVYLLDVCGHGMASALLSISVLGALSFKQLRGAEFRDPSSVLAALNAAFPQEAHAGQYFTVWYGVLDLRERTLSYASAGHPPALLLEDAAPPVELGTGGIMLGVVPEAQFPASRVAMKPGSRLVVFSDGAYELLRTDGTLLRYEDFLDEVRKPEKAGALPARMVRFGQAVRGGQPFEDDFSMLEIMLHG